MKKMKDTLEDTYLFLHNTPSDINEHLPVLKELASQSDSVVEMGVRWVVSTFAILAGKPKSLTSIDIQDPKTYNNRIDIASDFAKKEEINFEFILADTTKIEIDPCDFLFIDTWHVYDQLKKELDLHGNKAKKFLAFHDTVTFGKKGEGGSHKGLMLAIDEFMKENPHWKVKKHYTNNNGLLVLERTL